VQDPWSVWNARASEEALKRTRRANIQGLNQGLRDIGRAPADAPDPRALRFAEENMARGVRRVSEDTQRGITRAVQDGLRRGVRQEGIKRLVRETFDGEAWRIPVISRTELNRSANYGRLAAWRKSNVVQRKEWITAGDDRVRPSHAAIHGERVPKRQPFSLGVQAPPADPNCRCTVGPVTTLSQFNALDQNEQATTERVSGLVTLENELIRELRSVWREVRDATIRAARRQSQLRNPDRPRGRRVA
jgi:SPP1 gp7 family putative phage head morphogenesis protein